MRVTALVAGGARQRADAPLLLTPGRPGLCYGAAWTEIQRLAADLRKWGIGPGHTVASLLPKSFGPEVLVAFLAVLEAGAAFAPLSPGGKDELASVLQSLRPSCILVPADDPRHTDLPALVLERSHSSPAGVFGWRLRGTVGIGADVPAEVALLLHTSGSTGTPKLVALSHERLLVATTIVQRSIDLDQRDCCLNVMSPFHVGGLVSGLVLPLVAGGSVVCAGAFDPDAFSALVSEFAPTWYMGTPTIQRAILDAAKRGELKSPTPFRLSRSSAADTPPELEIELEAALGAPVMNVFGLTECCGPICATPLRRGDCPRGSIGSALGAELVVVDAEGNPLGPDEVGELLVRGPQVIAHYGLRPEEGDASFTADGFLRTGDLVRRDERNFFFYAGRLREQINRGGEKISPREVEAVLRSHPAVAETVAFAIPHATYGEDVAAAVELRPGAVGDAAELTHFLADRLAFHKVPKRILFPPHLPRTGTGKVVRVGLAALLQDELRGSAAHQVAPRDALERSVAAIWGTVLGRSALGVEDDFFELGGDSLTGTRILSHVLDAFGVEFTVRTLLEMPTIARFTAGLRAALDDGAPPSRGT